jgi:phosphohistidine phosphatase
MSENVFFVMRHAKSSWQTDGLADFDRPLAPRGETDARRMGRWLAAQASRPTVIISSSACRARRTAELVAEALGGVRLVLSEDLYLADFKQLIKILGRIPGVRDDDRTMIVGHNPGLESLLCYLDPQVDTAVAARKLMPTGAIFAFRVAEGGQPSERAGATLLWHCRPKDLPKDLDR